MDTLETQRGLLAFIRTIERLMEKNLIIEDSGTLSYGKDELGTDPPLEIERVNFGFQSVRGFAEFFLEEYNRLSAYDFEMKETDECVEVKTNWIE